MKVEVGLVFAALGLGATMGALRAVHGKMDRLGDAVKKDAAEYQRLGSIIKRTSEGPALDRMRQKQERLGDSIRRTRQELRRLASEDLKGRWADGLATVGSLMAARHVATAQNATESALRNIAITVGVARTADEGSLGVIAERAATEARLPLEQMLEAMGALAAGGMDSVRAFEQSVPVLGRAAKAWNASVSDMANTLLTTRNSLKLTDDARALNILGTGGKLGKFEIPDLARYLPSLAPAVASLGMTGEKGLASTVGYLQASREGAGTSEEAATNFANFVNKVASAEFAGRWEKLTGRSLAADQQAMIAKGYDAIGGTLKLIETYMAKGGQGKLLDALKNAKGDAEAEAAIKALQGAHGLGELFTDMQAAKFIRAAMMNADLQKRVASEALTGNPLDKDFADAIDTTDSRVQRIGSAWAGLMSRLSVAIKPVTDGFLDLASGALEWFNAAIDGNKGIAQGMVLVGGALAALKTGSMAVGILGAIGRVVSFGPGGGLVSGLFRLGGILPTVGSGVIGLARAIPAMGSALLTVGRYAALFGRGLLLGLGPIGLLIGAGYLLVTHWDEVKSAVGGAVEWMAGKWSGIRDAVSMAIGDAIDYLKSVPGRMLQAGRDIGAWLMDGLKSGAAGLWEGGKALADSAVTSVKNTLGIRSPSRVMMGIGQQVTEGLRIGIEGGAGGVLGQMGGLARALAAPIAAGAVAMGWAAMPVAAAPVAMGVAAMPASAGQGGVSIHNEFTITIHAAAGQDAQAIARAVMSEIERQQAARGRAALGDWS